MDRRIAARIETYLSCVFRSGDQVFPARARDLSVDGALIMAPNGAALVGARVAVDFGPGSTNGFVDADVVRVEGDGLKARYGLHFVGDAKRDAIEALAASLVASTGRSARAHPRISRYAAVSLRTPVEAEAVARDISRGGVGLQTKTAVSLGEKVVVALSLGDSEPTLEIEGAVRSVRPEGDGHLIGLEFDAMDEAMQARVDAVLNELIRNTDQS